VIEALPALQAMQDCRYAHRAVAGSAGHLGNVGLDASLDCVMEANAAEAAALLRLLGNERRLVLLCLMIAEGEVHVGRLAERVRLSQSAVSQHLAKLREDGLVVTRRTGATIYYRIADPRVERLIAVLRDVFCDPRPSGPGVPV
jgi:DNA-binding transcriptional ArsR family regulator